MNKEKIIFEINKKTGSKYGYLSFTNEKFSNVKEFFPPNEFKVEMEGDILANRKFDVVRQRLNLYPFRDKFNFGDKIVIERKSKNLFKLTKK